MTTPEIESVMSDKSTSFWLKDALEKALMRDPVDALNDAQILANLLSANLEQKNGMARATQIFKGPVGRVIAVNNGPINQTFKN